MSTGCFFWLFGEGVELLFGPFEGDEGPEEVAEEGDAGACACESARVTMEASVALMLVVEARRSTTGWGLATATGAEVGMVQSAMVDGKM